MTANTTGKTLLGHTNVNGLINGVYKSSRYLGVELNRHEVFIREACISLLNCNMVNKIIYFLLPNKRRGEVKINGSEKILINVKNGGRGVEKNGGLRMN